MLGKIGSEARMDIEKLMGTKVMLQAVGQGARGLAQPRGRSARPGLRGRVNARADHLRPGAAPRRLRRLRPHGHAVFPRTTGGVDAVARGCRRPKSPLINAVRALCQRRISTLFNKGSALPSNSARSRRVFYELRTDYERLHARRLLAEAAGRIAVMPDVPAEDAVSAYRCGRWRT